MKVLNTVPAAILVDVGTNIGLYTRQLLGWTANVKRTFAYEPEPYNFELLKQNTSYFDNVAAEMAAVAEKDGVFPFLLDLHNCGNNSLVFVDLGGAETKTATEARATSVTAEARRWMEGGCPTSISLTLRAMTKRSSRCYPMKSGAASLVESSRISTSRNSRLKSSWHFSIDMRTR